MWLVDVRIMCDRHLLEEHNECHTLAGLIHMKSNIDDHHKKKGVEVLSIKSRHDELAQELINRGYAHSSPLRLRPDDYSHLPKELINMHIDREKSLKRLIAYCGGCRKRKIKMKM